jgi:tetratricopeptide (TPR) repeat protein
MKFFLILIFTLSISFSFGQKKEIRKAIKLFESGDVQGAKDLLDSNTTLFDAADTKITNQKLYLEGKISQANKNFQLAYDNFNAYTEAGGKDLDYENQLQSLSSDIVNSAIEDNAEKRFTDATSKLYLAYTIFPEQNKDYLYYAASSAVNGKIFESALKYYNILKDMNYEGIVTKFMAMSVETNEEIELSETEYCLYKKTK